MNYSNFTQWCMKTELRERDTVIALLEIPSLLPSKPPVKPITARTPPAFEPHVRRRNRSGCCLHYSTVAAVDAAAEQRWCWWDLSIHNVAGRDFQLFQQFVEGKLKGGGTRLWCFSVFITSYSDFHLPPLRIILCVLSLSVDVFPLIWQANFKRPFEISQTRFYM